MNLHTECTLDRMDGGSLVIISSAREGWVGVKCPDCGTELKFRDRFTAQCSTCRVAITVDPVFEEKPPQYCHLCHATDCKHDVDPGRLLGVDVTVTPLSPEPSQVQAI